MKTLLLLVAMGVSVGQTIVAQVPSEPPPTLGQIMRPDEVKEMGLNKLSPEEMRKFESWLQRYRSGSPSSITPAEDRGNGPAETSEATPLAHFRFNGSAQDENPSNPAFELKATEFRDNALYLNGIYGYTADRSGYRATCKTPKLNYDHFSVVVRFKSEDFSVSKANLITGGTSYRWFGLSRSKEGNLVVTLNNQAFFREIKNARLTTGAWTTVACSVDLPGRKITVFLNGKKADTFELPPDFTLEVARTNSKESAKEWTFTNYSNGTVFHGLVDECTIYGGTLSDDQLARLPSASSSMASAPAGDRPVTPAPVSGDTDNFSGGLLAHFRFDGSADDEHQRNPPFVLKNTEFRENALYLNGLYANGAYRAVCSTPDLSYAKFTVALRFKAETFEDKKNTLFVGGTSYRWFGLSRSPDGVLTVTLNNQRFFRKITKAPLVEGKWTVVACGVDLSAHKVTVFFNGKKAEAFDLPKDFELDVMDSNARDREKEWTFTNYSNGSTFQGLVDECFIYGDMLSDEQFATIPLTP